jgi:hypothetical protein
MHRLHTLMLAACAALAAVCAHASNVEKSERLVNLHDLTTTVAIGDYYLKQECVLAARAALYRLGRERGLGPQWTPSNAYWQQAQAQLVDSLMQQVQRQYSNMEWLSEQWSQLNSHELSEPEMDALLAHFASDMGRKQVMIVDHSVAFHVVSTLTMMGKLQENLPGSEAERARMQELYVAEDEAMRFDPNDSPEATRFALSPVGKKYFVNAVLKVSGMVSQRLFQLAGALPARADALAPEVEPTIEAFRRSRSG